MTDRQAAISSPVPARASRARSVARLCMALFACACAWSPAYAQREAAPEGASGRVARKIAVAHKHMVVAAHPLAAEAGRAVLNAGGNALDAAVATQLALGVVE